MQGSSNIRRNFQDVGELIGGAPIGLMSSGDADAVLATPADAVAYYGPTAEFAQVNIDNICKALRAGKHTMVEKPLLRAHRLRTVGRTEAVRARVYGVSVERRIKNPAVAAICGAALAPPALRTPASAARR